MKRKKKAAKRQRALPVSRACVCCGAVATPLHRKPGEPNVMAVSLILTRKGVSKTVTRAAGSVRICESCLIRSRVRPRLGVNEEGRQLLIGVLERISGCYKSITDAEPGQKSPTSKEAPTCLALR